MLPKIILKKTKHVKARHPYIYNNAIKNHRDISPDSILKVVDEKNNLLGYAIAVEGDVLKASIVEFTSVETDILSQSYWNNKLNSIWNRKMSIPYLKFTEGFRFIFAESDGVPGTVVDIYKDTAVISYKYESAKIFQDFIVAFLKQKSIKNIVLKKSNKAISIIGEINNVIFKESNIKFISWIKGGQKTGFFLDQFLNRRIFSNYVEGKRVLNMFSYTGAFSFYALKHKATHVVSVDSSKKAMEVLEQHFEINDFSKDNHESYTEDAFNFLKNHTEKYDIIVLDPPAFTKHKKTLNKALVAYKRLNKMALKLLNKGGILFTFSCSQVVKDKDFNEVIIKAIKESNQRGCILHYLHQSPDHTININFPEGKYLKGIVVGV